MIVTPVAPAPTTDVPAGEAPPETPAPPATEPVVPAAPAADPEDPSSVADLGDGPDGDPVEGETPEQKLKRIARRADKERQAAERDRDAAVARATAAESQLSEASTAAQELVEAKTQVDTLTQDLTTANLTLLKYEVGADAELTMAQSLRLMGTTREELEADAQKFIADSALPGAGRVQQVVSNEKADREQFVEKMRRRR